MSGALFFFGEVMLLADAENCTAVLDLCLQNGFSYTGFSCDAEGNVRFRCTGATAAKLRRLCDARGISLRVLRRGGLPELFRRLAGRAGLILGMIAGAFLLFLSGRFVWDIRVTGNTSVPDSEVYSALRECGFTVGCPLSGFDAGELENRVLLSSDRFSWISVNLSGTVATVQVLENDEPPKEPSSSRPANLVAAADGQIEWIELYRGSPAVKVGQAVRAGELLVSGVTDSRSSGFYLTRAAGQVYARTERGFTVEIPLSYEQKVYEPAILDEIALNFFHFSLKFFKNTGNGNPTCDIIEKETVFFASAKRTVPVGVSVTERLPYRTETANRSPEEALSLAYAELDARMAGLSSEIRLLSKHTETEWTDEAVILHCTLQCIEDIARQSEFDFTESEPPKGEL